MDCPHGNKVKTCFWCSELPIEAGSKAAYERGYRDACLATGCVVMDSALPNIKEIFDVLAAVKEPPADDGVVPRAVYDLKQREVDIYKRQYEEAKRVLGEFFDHAVDQGWEDFDSDSEGVQEVKDVLYPERKLWADTKNDKPV